jgi:TP901 family phage tail tape measure protein
VGFESFTVLAIMEARDAASEVFAKIDESLGRFSGTAKDAADTARAAGDSIDDSLLKTASGADALDVATARVAAAQARAAETAKVQTAWEKELLNAQKAAAEAADGDATAQARLSEAGTRLTAATKESAAAQKGLADAQKLQSDNAAAAAAKNDEAAASTVAVSDASKKGGLNLAAMGRVAGITAAGLGIVAAVAVKAAGNFQSLTQHLVTDAGETQANLAMIRAGILSISTATGTSATDVTNAMYHIESAGIHGAAGLSVAKVAAEGAKIGNASLDTVSKTLVGTLTSYGMRSAKAATQTKYATSMMEELTATVSSGDVRMQDLASSLSNVVPFAAKAGISFAQVGGAIATMTSQNMSAQQATQDLGHMISALANPNAVQIKEMQQLGLSSNEVSKNLGKAGLTGTIDQLTTAITSHMGKSGTVLMSAFNNAKQAAADAGIEIKAMPESLQSLAKGFMSGSVTALQWRNDLLGLSPVQANLMKQFASTAEKSHSFNSMLTSGTPAAQTFNAALSKMTGGQTSLKAALMLSGSNAGVFAKNTADIARQGKGAAAMTQSWAAIQGTFNQKVDTAKTAVENTGIAIGTALLPAATKLFTEITKIVVPVAEWTSKHQKLTAILFAGVTALAATVAVLALASKAFKAVSNAVNTVKAAYNGAVSVMQKLAGKSKQTADQQAADAKKAAAANEKASADSAAAAETAAGEEEAASGEVAAAAETDATETAAANETAAAETSGSWITAAASTVAGWATAGAKMAAQAAVWAGQQAVKAGTVVANYVAGAATAAGSWLAAGARQVAGAAVWVAQSIGKVAIMVGASIAGAAATAAAWLIANAVMLLGIGLIVAAVVLAVILIVKNWGKISAAAKAVFHDVLAVIDSVIAWVKSHWPLLLAILLGPIAVAALEIAKHWKQIKDGAADLLGDLIRFFESLPDRILHSLDRLGSMMFSAGKSAISMLINGLKSIPVIGTMVSIAGDIADHFPHSPAKRGPLSGAGSPDVAGRNISRMLATGMLAARGTVAAASAQVAGAASLGGHAGTVGSSLALSAVGSASGGGTATIVIDVHGNTIMSDADITALTNKMGPVLVRALGQAGLKVRMG